MTCELRALTNSTYVEGPFELDRSERSWDAGSGVNSPGPGWFVGGFVVGRGGVVVGAGRGGVVVAAGRDVVPVAGWRGGAGGAATGAAARVASEAGAGECSATGVGLSTAARSGRSAIHEGVIGRAASSAPWARPQR